MHPNQKSYLKHWGIKGMRWGVRKDRDTGPVSDDHARYTQIRKKSLSQMSDKELRDLNARETAETQYRNAHRSTLEKGRSAVTTLLAGAAVVVGSAYAKKYIVMGSNWLVGQLGKKVNVNLPTVSING